MTSPRHDAVGIAILALGLLVAGCSTSEATRSTGELETSGAVETTTADAATTATAERLAGRYAHYDVVAYESADMKTLIITYGFTDLRVTNGVLMAQESFCHAEHRSDQPIETTISDAATSAIKPPNVAVTLTEQDGTTRLQRPETPTGIGIRLDDPANEVLPTDPNDPRIADDDNDGKPGITVSIKVSDALKGELYIARRERFAYDVTEEAGQLVGTVTDKSEQLIVGASDPMFVTDAPWVQVSDLSKSPIVLEKVSDERECEWLAAQRANLFGEPPVVDW